MPTSPPPSLGSRVSLVPPADLALRDLHGYRGRLERELTQLRERHCLSNEPSLLSRSFGLFASARVHPLSHCCLLTR